MARAVCTACVAVLLLVCVGCGEGDKGKGMQLSPSARAGETGGLVPVTSAEEMDLVEEVGSARAAYRHGLDLLIAYYRDSGNHMKRTWAEKELASLNVIPQYKYVIDAEIAGPELQAVESIPEADALYADALAYERKSRRLLILRDKDMLRMAIEKYNDVIRRYPTSNKIGDAAYRAGQLYHHFKDYRIAVTYYERSFQWDPATLYPSRFKAAWIYDDYYHNRERALQLYREGLEKLPRDRYLEWREFAELRVMGLSGSPPATLEP